VPRLAHNAVPSYRLHKHSGQAIVTLSGTDFLLGRHGSPGSKAEYDRLIGEWIANGRCLPTDQDLTVNELILAYWRYAKTYYVKSGKTTGELHAIKGAMRPLKELYGTTSAAAFRPLALQAVRQRMIEQRWVRRTVNDQVARIKRMFKWAVAQELVPLNLHHGLSTVDGLRRGRSQAVESTPVQQVDRTQVLAVIRYLSRTLARLIELQEAHSAHPSAGQRAAMDALARQVPDESPVAAMIAVQWLTGMRPGELVPLRAVDIDRRAEVWIFRPASHKTEHFGLRRSVPLGPRAQQILQPFLDNSSELPLFSPRQAVQARRRRQREARQSKVQPSQIDRSADYPKRPPGDHYTTASYRRAVTYACLKAGIPVWSPNQLRHSCGTKLRAEFGLEAARVVLGHTSVSTTEIYAERDERVAMDIMSKVG